MSRHLSDWLEYYLKYTENAESPTAYHLWSGIAAISTALRRKCFCNWGLQGYVYPNFYIVLVGPPGGRKGTAMKIAKNMLVKTEIPLGSDALGSTQRLYQEIMEAEAEYRTKDGRILKHKSLSIWSEEFQVFLSDKDQTLRAALTDLFDCPSVWNYGTLKRGTENLSNCFLTIIGAITPSLLQDKLTSDAVGGGLLSRIIMVVGYGPIKRVAMQFLSKEEEELQQHLEEDLAQISLLTGPFIMTTEFLEEYSNWYTNVPSSEGVDSEKFLGYNSRRALQVKKLSMILSASESDEMIIHARHFKKALGILKQAEHEMPNAYYGVGRGHHAEVLTSILRYIENKDMFTFGDLLDRFQLDAMPEDLQRYISIMLDTQRVKKETSATRTMYVVCHQNKKEYDDRYLERTLYSKMSR